MSLGSAMCCCMAAGRRRASAAVLWWLLLLLLFVRLRAAGSVCLPVVLCALEGRSERGRAEGWKRTIERHRTAPHTRSAALCCWCEVQKSRRRNSFQTAISTTNNNRATKTSDLDRKLSGEHEYAVGLHVALNAPEIESSKVPLIPAQTSQYLS